MYIYIIEINYFHDILCYPRENNNKTTKISKLKENIDFEYVFIIFIIKKIIM
jgi:hypothetical protein